MDLQTETSHNPDDVLKRLRVRRARPDDCEALATMDPDVHGGLDHYPALFHKYLKDPNRVIHVCSIDDRIVACQMSHVLDGGKTVLRQALKLHPQYRSTGLWSVIRTKLSEPPPGFPHITREVFATAVKPVYLRRMKKNTDKRINYILERPTVRLRPTKSYIDQLRTCSVTMLSNIPLTSPNTIEGDRVISLMQDKVNQAFIFPHRRIVRSWEPFRLLKSNMQRLTESDRLSHLICATPKDDKIGNAIGNEVESMSFGVAYSVPVGLRYDMDFYGNDVMDAASHIWKHLLHSVKFNQEGDLIFETFIPVTLDRAALKSVIEEKFKINCSSSPEMTCYIFEGRFRMHSKL